MEKAAKAGQRGRHRNKRGKMVKTNRGRQLHYLFLHFEEPAMKTEGRQTIDRQLRINLGKI